MNEKKRLLKNTGLIALGDSGAKAASFLLLPLYTSILTTEEYGVYDLIVAVNAFLLPVVTFSLHEAMFRFIIESGYDKQRFKEVVSHAFFMILLGIGLLGLIMWGITFFAPVRFVNYIWIYVTSNALYTFSNNLLRGQGKMKEYAIISSGKSIVQLLLNVLAVLVLRWGLEGLLFSMCASEIMAFIIVSATNKLWRQVSFRHFSRQTIKEMMLYSLPLIPNTLCTQVINLSDRLIINKVFGASANGIYSVSYKFPNIIETIYHYFYIAWSESASRVFNDGKEKAEKYYQYLCNVIDNMLFSVILLMTAGMPIIFRLLVRGEYIQGFQYVPLLLFAMYFASMSKFYSGIFTAYKNTKIMAVSTAVAAVINIIVNVFLIREYGLYAAAFSTLIADAVLVLMRRIHVKKYVKLESNWNHMIIKVIMAFIVLILYDYNNWWKIGSSILIVVIYSVYANRETMSVLLKSSKK